MIVSLLYFLLYFLGGLVLPFLPLWMNKELGILSENIGYLFSSAAIVKIVFIYYMMKWVDNTGKLALALQFSLAAVFLCIYLLSLNSEFYFIVTFYILFSSFYAALFPISDRCAMEVLDRKKTSFGSKRLWGSLGFLISVNIFGYFSVFIGMSNLPYVILVLIALLYLTSLGLHNSGDRTEANQAADRKIVKTPYLEIFQRKELLFIVFSCALVQSSNAFYYSFGSIVWADQGFSSFNISFFWIFGILSEILVFYFSDKIRDAFGVMSLIIVTCLATAVRWAALGTIASFWLIVIVQLLQGATISMNISILVNYILLSACLKRHFSRFSEIISFKPDYHMAVFLEHVLFIPNLSSNPVSTWIIMTTHTAEQGSVHPYAA